MRAQRLGRLLAAALVALLAIPGLPVAVVLADSATHLQVTTTSANPQVAGAAFDVTVTALDGADAIDTAFAGTVTFSGGGAVATLPAEYTFLAGDNGAHTFTGVVLTAAGTQTISAADTVTPSIGGFTDVVVGPADAATVVVAGYPSPTTIGVSHAFTVTARDTYDNVATGYMGTVGFSSDDPLASVPADYTFAPSDNGTHEFNATFGTAGTWSLTATDTTISSITGTQAGIAVGKRDQAIAFTSTAPTAAAVGGATYMPTATATSGLGVTFLIDAGSSGVCAIAGGVVSFSGVGTCTVNADQAGDANWNAAPRQQQPFAVGKGDQEITFTALGGRIFGDSPFGVSATASSGLAVTFSSLALAVCTVAGSTVSIVGAGDCTVRASQAGNANWNPAANVDRTFTVAKAGQATLTVNVVSPATYGTTQTLATSGGSGGGAVTYGQGASTACSVSGTTLSITAGTGTCAITATKAGDVNYTAQASAPAAVTVAKRNQAITFTSSAPSAAAVGTTYTPTATATSGLGVALSIAPASSSVCAIAAGVVSFNGVGTCEIDADQAGNTNWNAATRQQQSVGVGLGTTTTSVISSTNPSTYGGSITFTATVANADWTATGIVTFKDGAATLGTGTLSGGGAAFATSALVAGDHAITAVYGGDGHLAQSTSGALTQTVAKATLAVTADPASRQYGAANPALTATMSGFVNGDTAAAVAGAASCTTPAISTDPVGPYAVTCDVTGMSAVDYTFSPVAGTLTVTPAASAIGLAGAPAGGVGVYETKVPATFTATLGPTVGVTLPTGTATFLVDGVARPPVAIVGGLATLPGVTFATTGAHHLTATYAGDGGNFGPAPDATLGVPVVSNTVSASGVGVSGTTIYPISDTWRDTVAIRGRRLEPISVSITVYSPTGSRVRTKTFARASGAYSYAWNGRTSSGTILAAGKYRVVQVLADAYGARRTYTSYVTLSRKRMYWYTKTLTVSPGPRNYQMRSTTNTSVLSAPSSTTTGSLRMVNATAAPAWVAVGYQFSLPAASTYRWLSFEVRGSWTGATAPKIGIIPWNGGSWGSIYSLTRARATMGTSTTSYYAQTLTSLGGIVSSRSVRASIDSFAAPSGYGRGPFRYSITAVRLVVWYGILR